ncbi:MAG: NAD(P)H-dependent oxidoreductase [Bacteroidota bacterium]|nr:NAD(P)H-dependent oxidoreductase [Bacteroidota bacterium]
MLNVKIIIASTRPGRKGPALASWIFEAAKKQKEFTVEVLDLAEINLPFLDEPNLPRFQKYEKEHTKAWSKIIDAADAFIIVTPEYNYSFPATLKNAFDFLYHEWTYKPIAFVTYGGLAAGTRALQLLKPVVTALKLVPLVESVNISFFTKHIDEHGKFNANEEMEQSADAMLKELLFWGNGLKTMRVAKK